MGKGYRTQVRRLRERALYWAKNILPKYLVTCEKIDPLKGPTPLLLRTVSQCRRLQTTYARQLQSRPKPFRRTPYIHASEDAACGNIEQRERAEKKRCQQNKCTVGLSYNTF